MLQGGLACFQAVGAGSRGKGLPLQQRTRLIESPLPGHARLASACSTATRHYRHRDADSSHSCEQRLTTRDARCSLYSSYPYLPSFVACLMTSIRSPTRSEATSSSRKSASKSRRSPITLCTFAKVAAAILWSAACRSRPQPPLHSHVDLEHTAKGRAMHGILQAQHPQGKRSVAL